MSFVKGDRYKYYTRKNGRASATKKSTARE